MKEKYNIKIMEALHEILDIEMGETINDIRKFYSTTEILDAVLTHDGLRNYAYQIIGWIREIYGINLEEIEDVALDALTSDEVMATRKLIAEVVAPEKLTIDMGEVSDATVIVEDERAGMTDYEYLLEQKKILEGNITISERRCKENRQRLECINRIFKKHCERTDN